MGLPVHRTWIICVCFDINCLDPNKTQAAAGTKVVWEREKGLYYIRKATSFSKDKKRQFGQLLSLQSFIALSSFAESGIFTANFSCCALCPDSFSSFCCRIVCFLLYLFSYCLFPLFLLNLPSADSFCLCYLPHLILSVCSYRNRLFSARLCVCLY